MLRTQLTLIAAMLLGGCAWSHSVQFSLPEVQSLEDLSAEGKVTELPEVVKRCFADAPLNGGVVTTEISRKQARALRRIMQNIEDGKSPTEDEYAAAGCTGPASR